VHARLCLHLQNIFKTSVKHHTLTSYHQALQAVIDSHSQKQPARKRHADAVNALTQLLRGHNYIRAARVAAVKAETAAVRQRARRKSAAASARIVPHARDGCTTAERNLRSNESGLEDAPIAPDAHVARVAALSVSQRERVHRASRYADLDVPMADTAANGAGGTNAGDDTNLDADADSLDGSGSGGARSLGANELDGMPEGWLSASSHQRVRALKRVAAAQLTSW
jgi:hypothetical protein